MGAHGRNTSMRRSILCGAVVLMFALGALADTITYTTTGSFGGSSPTPTASAGCGTVQSAFSNATISTANNCLIAGGITINFEDASNTVVSPSNLSSGAFHVV